MSTELTALTISNLPHLSPENEHARQGRKCYRSLMGWKAFVTIGPTANIHFRGLQEPQ